MIEKECIAWLVPNMPNFYFMPSVWYKKLSTVFDSGDWDCPKWAREHGCEVIPVRKCRDDELPSCWLVDNNYGVFDDETVECCIELGKDVVPCCKIEE